MKRTYSSKIIQINNLLHTEEFTEAVRALPLVSVDWVVLNQERQLLLGLRRNAPARDWWFTPGGRVQKDEPFAQTLLRVARSELGLQELDITSVRLMGIWDHFYEDSAYSSDVSTHYVNLPHVVRLGSPLDLDALPSDQHSSWRWQSAQEAAVADDVHPYVQVYAQWVVDHLL